MADFKHIELEVKNRTATLWLNRPEKHNAFNELMLKEILQALEELKKQSTSLLVLRGRGASFCSGGDLNWFSDKKTDAGEIAKLLSECLFAIYNFSKPVITIAQGNVMGGGTGLMCASDIVLAEESAVFAFPEVTIGMAPAIISPYILQRIPLGRAKYFMFTGKKISSKEALKNHLVDFLLPSKKIDEFLNSIINKIQTASTLAMEETKSLLNKIHSLPVSAEAITMSTTVFSKMRDSDDFSEGVLALKEKRKPNWKI